MKNSNPKCSALIKHLQTQKSDILTCEKYSSHFACNGKEFTVYTKDEAIIAFSRFVKAFGASFKNTRQRRKYLSLDNVENQINIENVTYYIYRI